MKKLMIVATIVCVAAFAQAATYNWSGRCEWASEDGENGVVGKSVYFFSATDIASSALLADLTMDNINNYALDLSTGDNSTTTLAPDGTFTITGATRSFNAGAEGTKASAYALLLDDNGDKTYAFLMTASDVTIGTAHTSGTQLEFTFGGADQMGTPGSSGWTEVVTVPEPTSGLLLLIGMAGIALRRRRA